jgi:hypothetical protein
VNGLLSDAGPAGQQRAAVGDGGNAGCGHILWHDGRAPTPALPLSTGRGGKRGKIATNDGHALKGWRVAFEGGPDGLLSVGFLQCTRRQYRKLLDALFRGGDAGFGDAGLGWRAGRRSAPGVFTGG